MSVEYEAFHLPVLVLLVTTTVYLVWRFVAFWLDIYFGAAPPVAAPPVAPPPVPPGRLSRVLPDGVDTRPLPVVPEWVRVKLHE